MSIFTLGKDARKTLETCAKEFGVQDRLPAVEEMSVKIPAPKLIIDKYCTIS